MRSLLAVAAFAKAGYAKASRIVKQAGVEAQ
jgi:hypothetical protein